ncbi:hypothetical protein NDU88_001594 [Pleurodeles waltl]|uniref:Uncharacterized protein n=1 Tax=Pleurodeles waltl TaxID=8319 RepID=A0AAV7UTS5_PLEWA|nr:hypothetical protein NDU88_001594 [Pleurodeles waltl]
MGTLPPGSLPASLVRSLASRWVEPLPDCSSRSGRRHLLLCKLVILWWFFLAVLHYGVVFAVRRFLLVIAITPFNPGKGAKLLLLPAVPRKLLLISSRPEDIRVGNPCVGSAPGVRRVRPKCRPVTVP